MPARIVLAHVAEQSYDSDSVASMKWRHFEPAIDVRRDAPGIPPAVRLRCDEPISRHGLSFFDRAVGLQNLSPTREPGYELKKKGAAPLLLKNARAGKLDGDVCEIHHDRNRRLQRSSLV